MKLTPEQLKLLEAGVNKSLLESKMVKAQTRSVELENIQREAEKGLYKTWFGRKILPYLDKFNKMR